MSAYANKLPRQMQCTCCGLVKPRKGCKTVPGQGLVPAEDRRSGIERRQGPRERRAESDTPDRRRQVRRAAVAEVQQLVREHGITDEELAAIAAELAQEQ